MHGHKQQLKKTWKNTMECLFQSPTHQRRALRALVKLIRVLLLKAVKQNRVHNSCSQTFDSSFFIDSRSPLELYLFFCTSSYYGTLRFFSIILFIFFPAPTAEKMCWLFRGGQDFQCGHCPKVLHRCTPLEETHLVAGDHPVPRMKNLREIKIHDTL